MRIRVMFWLDVEDPEALKRLANSDDLEGARWFVKSEAADHTWEYLDSNGVACRLRREGEPWS